MHKIVTIWIGEGRDSGGRHRKSLPYAETETPFQQSVAEIKTLLQKFNCEKIIDFQERSKDPRMPSVMFNTIGFEKDGLRYLIDFPITYVEHSKGKRLNMDISGRIVFNRVKALLVDAEINYLTFHEAMLPYLAIPSAQGTRSVMDMVQAQLEEIKKGTTNLLMLPGGHS